MVRGLQECVCVCLCVAATLLVHTWRWQAIWKALGWKAWEAERRRATERTLHHAVSTHNRQWLRARGVVVRDCCGQYVCHAPAQQAVLLAFLVDMGREEGRLRRAVWRASLEEHSHLLLAGLVQGQGMSLEHLADLAVGPARDQEA